MADGGYWSEVDRQSPDLSDQDKRELKFLLSVLHGKRQSKERFLRRVKWAGVAVGIVAGIEQSWDWILKVLGHHP